ncbi:acyltransferase family protein [Pseudomonas nicosulfuronedens]
MSGIFRFILSLLVVMAHLTEGIYRLSHYGVFAVFGFYVISGYLITLILNKTYSFKLAPFSVNRFLRLFPIYYLVAAITLVIFRIIPGSHIFHPIWPESASMADKLANVLIFPFAFYEESFRVVPPTWSVAVELVCYFMLWAVIARSKLIATATCLAAVAYHAYSFAIGETWDVRYAPFYAAVLPFSLGALIHFHRKMLDNLLANKWKPILSTLAALWLLNAILCGENGGLGAQGFDKFFYINLLALTAICALITNSQIDARMKIAGKKLGDLAYPIFLTHWVVGFVMSKFIGESRGLELFFVSTPAIIALSYFLVKLADSIIEPIRDSVRPKGTRAEARGRSESPA